MRARQAACGIDREYRAAGGNAAGLLTDRHRQFSEAKSVRGYRFSISANFCREPRHPHELYRHLRKSAPQRATIVDRARSACCDTGLQDFRHDTDGRRIRCCCFPCRMGKSYEQGRWTFHCCGCRALWIMGGRNSVGGVLQLGPAISRHADQTGNSMELPLFS